MENYYYNSSTILKYLRKVLNEIHGDYVDSGIRAGFIMKRYGEKYNFDSMNLAHLVLLCMLKDIGCYYQDGVIDRDDYALASASSYCFLKHCSPLGAAAKPLLYYNAKYMEEIDSEDYQYGLLITLINLVVRYVYEEYTLDEIESMLKRDTSGRLNPDQVKKLIKLLRTDQDILEKLNQKNSIFVHETCSYVQHAEYTDKELLRYIDMTNFSFEFHNHETLAHTVTTAAIAKELAKLSRLTPDQINCIYLAALVHDIGKIRVPVEVLCHPGRLEGDYLKEMRRHVEYTKEILEGSFSYKIVEIASNHHEKLDGSGYPRGLRAIDLSIGDKIISIADVASALYCKRSYKRSLSKDEIIAILESDAEAGKIDTRITNHLINNFDAIFAIAKEEEQRVLDEYNAMHEEYEALAKSDLLRKFYQFDDEAQPLMEEPEQRVIYVDDDGNIIDDIDEFVEESLEKNDEIDEALDAIPEVEAEEEQEESVIEEADNVEEETAQEEVIDFEAEFKRMLSAIPEMNDNQEETEEIEESIEEESEDDEFEQMINSIPEKNIEAIEETNEEAETVDEEITEDDEFEQMINSIPEKNTEAIEETNEENQMVEDSDEETIDQEENYEESEPVVEDVGAEDAEFEQMVNSIPEVNEVTEEESETVEEILVEEPTNEVFEDSDVEDDTVIDDETIISEENNESEAQEVEETINEEIIEEDEEAIEEPECIKVFEVSITAKNDSLDKKEYDTLEDALNSVKKVLEAEEDPKYICVQELTQTEDGLETRVIWEKEFEDEEIIEEEIEDDDQDLDFLNDDDEEI